MLACAKLVGSRRVRLCEFDFSPLRFVVPLSEEEQRVLAEIERTFYEEDPTFVRAVRNADPIATGSRIADRPTGKARSKPLGFSSARPIPPFFALAAVGAGLMTFGYSVHVALGFLGVLIMFAGLLLVASELKRRLHSSIANGAEPFSVRLAARVDAQRAMRELQAEQSRQAKLRRNGQKPPDNVEPPQ